MKLEVETLKIRLDKFLAEETKISRSKIQRDVEAGLVKVNGSVQKESNFVVRKGDEVQYQISNIKSQKREAKNIPLKTLYNNHGLLIIDKPAGLSVHPGAGVKGDSLTQALLYHFKDIAVVGEEHRPGIVHRLDKDTSGVILVALTQEMYEYLKDAFAERKVRKEYIALVKGVPEKAHGFIDTPIGKSKSDFRKYATNNIIEPKESLTEYRVLEVLPGSVALYGLQSKIADKYPFAKASGHKSAHYTDTIDKMALISVKLHTGRTHQIRVHMNSIGNPLMGDQLYGGKKTVLEGLSRQFLHARRIEVQLPDGTWIEAESELSEDLRNVLASLGSKLVNTL
jgi:23S rRNA pseudouridine1911/1915/1917 synthase